MKKIISLLAVLAVCSFVFSGCKSIVTFDNLPAEAQTFLTENFPDSPVSYAVKEFNEYDVVLANGAEISFNRKGEWKSVDMNHGVVQLSNGLELEFNSKGVCKRIDD